MSPSANEATYDAREMLRGSDDCHRVLIRDKGGCLWAPTLAYVIHAAMVGYGYAVLIITG